MLRKVTDYIEKWNMLQQKDHIIVGVSGGADSVCLLFVLLSLQEQYHLTLHVVHVNHGLRGEAADADEAYVRRLCEENQLPLTVCREDVEYLAKKWKQSQEEAGRELRRQTFEKVRQEDGGGKIALAHHRNDNAETLLLNLARGTGLAGLGGILPINGCYIRPLLDLSREEIEDFLQEQGISYCVDATNEEEEYVRNRIRNRILPYMEEHIHQGAIRHMTDTMEYLQDVQRYLEGEMENWWRLGVIEEENGCVLLQTMWQEIPEIFRPMLLKKMLTKVAGRAKDLTARHLTLVGELMEKQVGRQADLPYDLVARRIYRGILIEKKKEQKEHPPIFLKPTEEWQMACWNRHHFRYRVIKKEDWDEKRLENSSMKAFDYGIINGMLCIRGREAGDYMILSKDGGRQKVKSFFINEKVDRELRDEIPLVAEDNRILWIAGYREDPGYKVSEHTTRILEIQIEKEKNHGRDSKSNDRGGRSKPQN